MPPNAPIINQSKPGEVSRVVFVDYYVLLLLWLWLWFFLLLLWSWLWLLVVVFIVACLLCCRYLLFGEGSYTDYITNCVDVIRSK